MIAARPPFDLSGSVRLIPNQQSGVSPSAADKAVRVRLTSLDDISPSGPVEATASGDGTFSLRSAPQGSLTEISGRMNGDFPSLLCRHPEPANVATAISASALPVALEPRAS
jgi:hypothetical protein